VFLAGLGADTLHLVGHSLGGLVILKLFGNAAARAGADQGTTSLPPGRIVLLGSPVQGSRAARNLSLRPFGRRMLGLTAHQALLPERERQWRSTRELGIIAGTVPMGLGRFMGPFDSPSDGTVLLRETHLVGAKQHLSMRTTHTGMVYSPEVARQAAAFLRDGRFAGEEPR
jgi:hypothetical protein